MSRRSIAILTLMTLLSSLLYIRVNMVGVVMAPIDYRVHNLNSGLDYATIQEAINANETLPRHTILIEEGTYYEHLVLNKTLSLVGEKRNTTIIDGNEFGIVINVTAPEVTITSLTVRNGGTRSYGIYIASNNNSVLLSEITSNWGIMLWNCSGNALSRNNVYNNSAGISLESSSSNIISENRFEDIECAIYFNYSPHNLFYHNNFMGVQLVSSIPVFPNVWDNGLEGNYWSGWTWAEWIDSNHDGIGDSPFGVFDDADNHPLMGMFCSFNTSLGYEVELVSNSTVEDFEYFDFNKTIRFHISNTTVAQTSGFCRICIPHILMSPENISVTIDNEETPILYENHTLYDNGTHRWIYFAYEHSTHEVTIIESGLPNPNACNLPVPYEGQGNTHWCWAASTAMLLRYYGKNVHTWDVGKSMPLCMNLGQIKNFIDAKYSGVFETLVGVYSSISDQTREDIQGNLSRGYPILLRVFSWAMGGHMVVVTGYNSSGFFINDPSGALFVKGLGRPFSRSHEYIRDFASWQELRPLVEIGLFSDVFIVIQGKPQPMDATLHIDNQDETSVWTTHGQNDDSGIHITYSEWYWAWGLYWQPRGSHTNEWDPQDILYYGCWIYNHKNRDVKLDFHFEIKNKDNGICCEKYFTDIVISSLGSYCVSRMLPLAEANLTKGEEYTVVFEIRHYGSTEIVDSIMLPPISYGVKSAIFKAECPVRMLVTDPDGLRVGYDLPSNQTFNAVPGATYFYTDGLMPEIVSITNQKVGIYSVKIFGVQTGTYNLTCASCDETGVLSTSQFINISIEENQTQSYTVPEFASHFTLGLFMISTLVAVIDHRRKRIGVGQKTVPR